LQIILTHALVRSKPLKVKIIEFHKAAFAAAHLTATVEVYDGCNNGWMVRGSQVYNQAGSERAWPN